MVFLKPDKQVPDNLIGPGSFFYVILYILIVAVLHEIAPYAICLIGTYLLLDDNRTGSPCTSP